MTESALPRPSRYPWLVPAALLLVLVAVLVAVILFARESGKSDAPGSVGEFQRPPALTYTAYDVERSESGLLKLTQGAGQQSITLDVQLTSAHRIWLLEPVAIADIKPPLVVNVVSIPNEVRNYTIKLLAFAPVPPSVGFDAAFIPLADGFAGYEASRDVVERVVVSAVLETFDGRNGTTTTSTGPGTLYLDPGAPIRMLRSGAAADIKPGDRIAFHKGADGKPDPTQGVLVLTGGAR